MAQRGGGRCVGRGGGRATSRRRRTAASAAPAVALEALEIGLEIGRGGGGPCYVTTGTQGTSRGPLDYSRLASRVPVGSGQGRLGAHHGAASAGGRVGDAHRRSSARPCTGAVVAAQKMRLGAGGAPDDFAKERATASAAEPLHSSAVVSAHRLLERRQERLAHRPVWMRRHRQHSERPERIRRRMEGART